jgi:NhaP-type Na+/H+ or K+/H+ antiporter
MDPSTLTAIFLMLFGFSLISKRTEGTIITAPILFAAAGFIASKNYFGVVNINVNHHTIHTIAELTLILLLFADASRIKFKLLARQHNLALRMLVIGLPLTILFGTGIASAYFPHLSIWEAGLLAALLAPTDAALGQTVVTAKAVPLRMRQTVNVESGLNDGIALPVVLMMAALSATDNASLGGGEWLTFAFFQIGLGPIAGIAIGWIGAKLLDHAISNGWASTPFEGVATLSLAILAYIISELIGGNGFIAAFVAGMTFGNTLKANPTFLLEFMESEGSLLMLLTFLVYGATLLPEGLALFKPEYLVFALLSLTVIRMIPIALSLIGSGIRAPTYGFLGWFGPRGLASILFLLLIIEEEAITHREELFAITILTVGLSILLHGVSAAPLSNRYGKYLRAYPDSIENREVSDIPLRQGNEHH